MIRSKEDEDQAYEIRNKHWVVGEEWGDVKLNKLNFGCKLETSRADDSENFCLHF